MTTAYDFDPVDQPPDTGNVHPLRPKCDQLSCWSLEGDHDPHGPDVHRVSNVVESYRWLLSEVGAGGLSGVFMRGDAPVYTSAIGEDGYIAPPKDGPENLPAHKRNHNGPATMRPVTAKTLRARLAVDYMIWKKPEGKKGQPPRRKETFFPGEAADLVVEGMMQGIAPNIRHLAGITHTPMVRADGTILDVPGYDDASGYLYLPDIEVAPVPPSPTGGQRAEAVARVRGMIDEFAWAGDHDEANFLGALLTPLLRLVCPPPYKLIAIMARQPGSGKSLLNRILREVHGGVFRSEMPHDDAELEKTISSILTCTTAPVVQFDNVSGVLRSSRLAGLLTSEEYSGRILGSTNNVPMTNDRMWSVTGNNLSFGGDLIRRSLWATIDPRCPDPHLRTGFKLDIPTYLREHRADILHALLTIVAAWTADGRPLLDARSSDDYNTWTRTVGGILANLEVPDLGTFAHEDSAQQKVGADDEGWGEFLAAVDEVMGGHSWTVRNLVDEMGMAAADPKRADRLVEALPADLNDKYHRSGGRAITQSLGKWVRNRNGRWAGNVVCEQVGTESTTKSAIWKIRRVGGDAQ